MVARISYNKDIFFKIIDIKEELRLAVLKGLNVRVIADAPIDDLVIPSPAEIRSYKRDYIKNSNEYLERIFYRRELEKQKRFLRRVNDSGGNSSFDVPGVVLHVDGDEEYLNLCITTYKQLDIQAYGICLAERDQPKKMHKLLVEHNPDILVITGHDGLRKE